MVDLTLNEDLPSGWQSMPLGRIATIQSGGTPSRKIAEFFVGEIPWVKTLDLNENLVLSTEESITEEAFQSIGGRLRPPMTVMVAMYGGAGTVGKSGLLGISASTNQAVCCIEPNSETFDSWYLLYYLISYRRKWMQFAVGTRKDPNISKGIIVNTEVPLPPLAEQGTIAGVLRTVQRAKEATEKVIAAARQLKHSLMRHLFTFGPVPFQAADQVELQETEIGTCPASWKLTTIGKVSELKTGGTPSRSVPEYWNGDIPWVKTGEVDYERIDLTDEFITREGLENSTARLFPAGTLLMAMYGQGVTRGRVARLGIDATTNQACAAIFPNESASTDFLFVLLTHIYQRLREMGHGANQRNLNMAVLRSVEILLPPRAEQEAIVEAVAPLDAKIRAEEQRARHLGAAFDSLLHELMSGQRRVAGFDEPEGQ